MSENPKTLEEIEASVALDRAKAEQALAAVRQHDAETAFFTAHAKAAAAGAEEQQISLRAKKRVEKAVLADNALNHVYLFDGPVGAKSVKACVKQLTTWARTSPPGKPCAIEVQINSPGGDIFQGFALIDFIRGLSKAGHYITAVTYGMAASMGGVLLQAADHRVIGANSFLLLHEGSLFAGGDYSHFEDQYKLMQQLHGRILDLFASRAKVDQKYIREHWERKDWWVTASESLKLGFVDEVR